VSFLALLGLLGLSASPASAWQGHQVLMPSVWAGLPASLRERLSRHEPPPCPEQESQRLKEWVAEFELNPAARLERLSPGCGSGEQLIPRDLLLGKDWVDEPDQGMDRDRPPSSDPRAQRHVRYGGWKPYRPLTTFQWPARPIGLGAERARLFADRARGLIRSGNTLLAMRLLSWSMHYLQDLAQPFRSSQIPTVRMLPWYTLLHLPLRAAFDDFLAESARIVGNYHVAYERYVSDRLTQDEKSPFAECLSRPSAFASLAFDPASEGIDELSRAVSSQSAELASAVGDASLGLFGDELKLREFDLGRGRGTVKYDELAIRPDLEAPRQRLEASSCAALATAVLASRSLIEWAFQP
jgi:hypothetical protein